MDVGGCWDGHLKVTVGIPTNADMVSGEIG